MTSLTSNMTPSEILSLNLNDSSLDLLNAAIASHQVKLEQLEDQQQPHKDNGNVSTTEDEATSPTSTTTTTSSKKHANSKRELDKDGQTVTAPKRAGRKPLDKLQLENAPLDPKQKRKAQNRAAQRAFRDRKEKHVAELQARIDELEALNATKDEDLKKENEQLKEELKKLKEENYALKGAQFTFEFPVQVNNKQQDMHHHSDISHQQPAFYHTSGSSMSSGNSYSGDSSAEQSPLSNSHTHEDDSASADTPITTNLFSSEPLQFGLINSSNNNQQQHHVNNSLDFLAVSGNNNNNFFSLSNNGLISTSQNFPTATNTTSNTFPTTVDLFHGKDDLFTNFQQQRAPTQQQQQQQQDDFLFANEDLSSLFGGNNELFGFNNNQFSFNAQFGLPETPATKKMCTKEKKQLLVEKIKKGREEGKYMYQVHQEVQAACPDFDLDLLCHEYKMKATCTMNPRPISDGDVDAFVKCLDRV